MEQQYVLAFLPYLRTRDRCVIRGIDFRSIKDVEGLDLNVKQHIERLARMFATCQGNTIAEPTFASIPVTDNESFVTANRLLTEAQLLVTYVYGAPHPSPTSTDDVFLGAECATLFTFLPNRIISSLAITTKSELESGRVIVDAPDTLPDDDFIEGYDGRRNQIVPLWVADGSRVYPEVPNLCLNHLQRLDLDIERFFSHQKHWPFRLLFSGKDMAQNNQARVFTALLWYSRSCRSVADHPEKLLYLAIALESLLDLDKKERVTERFKTAVLTLVGPVSRLDEWLTQFYDARSTTVHQGNPDQLWFRVPSTNKDTLPHRALIVYGRRIFRICLTAVLTGIMLTEEAKVASLLVHNNERLQQICKVFSKKGTPSADALREVKDQIEELHECQTLSLNPQLEEDLDTLLASARMILNAYRECKEITDSELDALLSTVELTGTASQKLYEALKKITECLRNHVRVHRRGSEIDEIALRFFEFASRPAVALAIHLHTAQL